MDNWSLSVSSTTDAKGAKVLFSSFCPLYLSISFSKWSKAVPAVNTTNSPSSALSFADKPWIVANPVSGNVHVVFNSQFPFASTSIDEGKTWSTPILLDKEIKDPYYYFYAGGGGTLGDGTSVALFVAIPNNDPPFDKSKPYGYVRAYFKAQNQNWRASTVSVIQYGEKIEQACPKTAQCKDKWQFLSGSATCSVASDAVHVVWLEGVNNAGVIYYSMSTTLGKSWSTPRAISPSPMSSFAYTAFPAITVSMDSNDIFIGWMSNHTGMWKTLVSHNFQNAIASSEPFEFPFGDYWQMALDNKNRILHAIWGQGNGWFLNGTSNYAHTKF